jgi:hypothetical protein
MRDDWVKMAVWLATLTIINSVYGNRGNQAVVSFSRIQKYIEGGGIRLKKPVRDAFSDPVLSGFIRGSRVKYHVHLVLRMLASNGFLMHDKRHSRFIITSISPLWEPAYSGNVSELYEVIMRVVGGFMSGQRLVHHPQKPPLSTWAHEGVRHAPN